ncbi:MAG: bifunctional hydroxymethylpyrimidine kinase/phosphomethylpyrimidine kinase [Oligoflexales bacterium]|nr:bifunctional hydroxymethylpyrimidine kinase/phosphomethylpyrimidine kinase [Oligoflexales bacterium]
MKKNFHSNEQTIIWSISALDNSAGAGIAADIRTAAALGVHLCPVATAITAQNNQGVYAVCPASKEILEQQCQSLLGEFFPSVIKVGLLPNREVVIWLAEFLKKIDVYVIADTPLLSSSGGSLVADDVVDAIREYLLPQVHLLTPNYNEALQLIQSKQNLNSVKDQEFADVLLGCGIGALYLKGGHAPESENEKCKVKVHDFFADHKQRYYLSSQKIDKDLRGTGCILATAVACFLAKKNDLSEAIVLAKDFINQQYSHSQLIGSRHYAESFELQDPNDLSLPRISQFIEPLCENFKAIEEIGFYPIVEDTALIKPLLELGIKTIQLRVKGKVLVEVEQMVKDADQLCKEKNAQLFINDYWQLAIKYNCFGVHLGQEDLLTADLVAISTAGLRLGLSSHSYEEAARILAIKPSYVALGPIFETTCKSMRFGPQGFEKLAIWKRIFPNTPIVAIGGLKRQHVTELKKYKVNGVAVISDVVKDAEPLKAAAEWLSLLH